MNNFSYFPPSYREELDKQKQQRFSSIQKETSEKITNINNTKISNSASGKAVGICVGIGAIVGLVGFCSSCSACNGTIKSGGGASALDTATCQLFGGVGTFFLAILIGLVVGGIIELIIVIARKASDKSIDKNIQKSHNNELVLKEEVTQELEKDYSEYVLQFENEAKRQSIKFAESQLAKEVITWMTNGFCSAIDATDRRPHIQEIDVPFVFNVYCNKITCNIGTYDFELKRCANLTSVMDQAALTRAIASAIQLNVVMKYPKDISGESINVNIEYTYTKDSAVATLRYTAYNGNYRPTMSWDQ